MQSIKYLAFPLLALSLVMTGCASRKPAVDITSGTTTPTEAITVNTTAGEDVQRQCTKPCGCIF